MTEATTTRLVLASGSARRAQLMSDNGYRFVVVAPELQEPEDDRSTAPPHHYAEALSYYKARAAARICQIQDAVIVGADTVVAYEDRIYGKPADADDARYILSTLAGTTHSVITGVTVLRPKTNTRLISHEVTRVTMRPMSADVLDRYIASGTWRGKAGAYGIQDKSDAYVERLEGSFSNVVGLPMSLLARMLRRVGFTEVPENHVNGSAVG